MQTYPNALHSHYTQGARVTICTYLHATSAIGTVVALDLVVDVFPGVLRLGNGAVDEQCEVGEVVEDDRVVKVAVVETVLVAWTRLAEVRQLVQLVAAPQSDLRDAVRRRVVGPQVVADRTLYPHVRDVQRPVVAAVAQYRQSVGGRTDDQFDFVDGHLTVRVDDVTLEGMILDRTVLEVRLQHNQIAVDVDEHGAAE